MKATKSPPVAGMVPNYQDMPLTVHTHNTRAPTPQEIAASENMGALLSQNIPMSVLARGDPEIIDQ